MHGGVRYSVVEYYRRVEVFFLLFKTWCTQGALQNNMFDSIDRFQAKLARRASVNTLCRLLYMHRQYGAQASTVGPIKRTEKF